MNLPHHRRYNWKLVWRTYRPACAWIALLLLIALVMLGIEQTFTEHNARLDAENAHASAKLEAYRLATQGAPGYVHTDWVEGTTDIEVRNP